MAAASGETDVTAGALPGVDMVTVTVAAAGCTAASQVEAWLLPKATADHSLDEHLIDPPMIVAHSPATGSFSVTISARPESTLAAVSISHRQSLGSRPSDRASCLVYGSWHIGWVHS